MQDHHHTERNAADLSAEGWRIAVVASRFNQALVDRLVEAARRCLREHGVADRNLPVERVPGAFEIPLALRLLADQGSWDGLVALGVVIRGGTPHFDYVCAEASRGIARVSLEARLPIGFGLLTCDTHEQAEARAGGAVGNKGREAALATLEMIDLGHRLGRQEGTPANR